jgi:hypothetical protein
MGIPTREELNAAVEHHFRHLYPDAPLKLSRSGSHDEAYRNAWLEIRDALLDSEVNRIYWERFPDGPLKLDPENPDHNPYVNGWLEIRDGRLPGGRLDLVLDSSRLNGCSRRRRNQDHRHRTGDDHAEEYTPEEARSHPHDEPPQRPPVFAHGLVVTT